MRFVVDMNLSPLWKNVLTNAGMEAVHWVDLGPTNYQDAQIMAWARDNGRAVFTSDLDFGQMLAVAGSQLPSIVQLRVGRHSPAKLAPMVIAAIEQAREELEAGALLTIDPSRWRVRLLPISRTF